MRCTSAGRAARVVISCGLAIGSVLGCTSQQPGTPTAAQSTSTAPSSSAPSSSAPSKMPTTTTANGLAGVDPCSLLTSADVARLGLPDARGRRDDLAGALRCVWPVGGKSIRTVIDPNRGLDDTNTGNATKVESVTVGRHEGRRVEESSGPGYCDYDLAISEKSTVTVAALDLDGTAQACTMADQAVKIVEPKLP
jgi:hypothetical protein